MKKIAAISTILADPAKTQTQFNSVVSDFQDIVRGRLGCPFEDERIAAICIIAYAEEDKLNAFNDMLSAIDGATVNTVIH